MTNRERYITKRDEYDLMFDMLKSGVCPIAVVIGQKNVKRVKVCKALIEDCPFCIQKWLNEEVVP